MNYTDTRDPNYLMDIVRKKYNELKGITEEVGIKTALTLFSKVIDEKESVIENRHDNDLAQTIILILPILILNCDRLYKGDQKLVKDMFNFEFVENAF